MVSKKESALTPAQKRLVGFIVMHPYALPRLETVGIREYLTGGMGEILFLQIRSLLEGGQDVQPEDLMSALPDGPERQFVTEMLLKAPSLHPHTLDGEDLENEANEVMEWLKTENLQRISADLLRKISSFKRDRDPAALELLLQQKQKVDRELRGIID